MDLARLLLLIALIRDAVQRHARIDVPAFLPFATYFTQKLTRTRAKIEALFLKWQTGWRPKPREYVFSGNRPASVRTTPDVPTRKGWYADALAFDKSHDVAVYTSELEEYLHNPVMQEFLKDVPQAGRLLRPIAQMFHAKIPEVLERPKNPFPKRPYKPRPPKPKPVPQPPQYATVQDSFIPTIDQIARPGTLRWMILKSQGGD
jgi:hypothetical protein